MENNFKAISLKELIKRNKGMTVTVVLLSTVVSLGAVLIGYLLMELLQVEVINGSYSLLFSWTIKLLIIAVVYTILRYTTSKLKAILIKKWVMESKELISNKIIHMDYFDVTNTPAGDFVSWYSNDIEKVVSNYFDPFFTLVSNLTLSVFAIVAIFYISYILGFCTLGLWVLMTVFPMIAGRQVGIATDELSKTQEEYTNTVTGTIMGYEQFKNFNTFSWMKKLIHNSNEEVEGKRYKYNIKFAIVQNGMIFLNNIAQIILIAVAVYLVNKGATELGAVLSIIVLSSNFFSAAMGLLETSMLFSSVNGIIKKLTFEDKDNKNNYPGELSEITTNSCTALLGKNKINVEDIKINRNDKCVITGPSGKGKSTLLKLILGKVQNYEGNIKLNENSLETLKGGDFSESVTYLTQDPYVFNTSIRENITMGEDYTDEEISEALKSVYVDEFINNLADGLDTKIENMGKNISGGEKQKIVLARGIIRKNSTLILDEALSAIDVETSDLILENLLINPALTLIIISHHFDEKQLSEFNNVIEYK